ncbi:MAG: hypothetical protein LIO93_10135 [Bacteroidales bacterium]|nr:hypothetical protein [Bacteroidales bacterium]
MKRWQKIIFIVITVLLMTIGYLYWMHTTFIDRRIKKGNELVEIIEQFRIEHNRLPFNLEECGISASGDNYWGNSYKDVTFYYTLGSDKQEYILEFFIDWENNMGYLSKEKLWTDKYIVDNDDCYLK